ncbi:hypothetical protein KAX17_08425 [Candidatus Bipolaricaulota bacterium]|nr:hypothetical protein [Candidatus Bipolaricaulota bacterium]
MTEIKVDSDQEILREAEEVLRVHLGPAKATRFWIALSGGTRDYLQIKETLFKGETVNTLYQKIAEYKGEER